jgi:hypothetical protein
MEHWVDVVVAAAILGTVGRPLLTLWHELGHATVPLILRSGLVRIRLGKSGTCCSVRVGQLQVEVSRAPSIGHCSWPPLGSRWANMAAVLMGPLFSLVALLFLGALFWTSSSGLTKALTGGGALLAALQFLCTVLPFRYPEWWTGYAGERSDGQRLLEVLREASRR